MKDMKAQQKVTGNLGVETSPFRGGNPDVCFSAFPGMAHLKNPWRDE